jgi:hypothetical protein
MKEKTLKASWLNPDESYISPESAVPLNHPTKLADFKNR